MTVRAAGPDDLDALVRFSAAMAFETEGRRLDQDRLRKGIAAGFAIIVAGANITFPIAAMTGVIG